jgi:hypothetical protein
VRKITRNSPNGYNSHRGQIVSIKNASEGAPNLRDESIALFPLPPESLSTQKTESLDQVRKEVPRGKMGRLVEAIDLGIRN